VRAGARARHSHWAGVSMATTTAPAPLGEAQALEWVDWAVRESQAEGASIGLSASRSAASRFARNQITQNLVRDRLQLSVTSCFGQRSATATTTELDAEAVRATLRRSEELARVAPPDPEWVPLLAPQAYPARAPAFDEATAALSPLARGETVRQACQQCERAGTEGAGTFATRAIAQAVGNTNGLRAYDCGTDADFSLSARVGDGASWNQRTAWSAAQLPTEAVTETAIARALDARQPRAIPPGDYPVVFDAAALAELLPWVVRNLDARAADEGRSFMARTDAQGQPGGNRLGEALFSPRVTVRRDPGHPLLQTGRFFGDGLSNTPLTVIAKGMPQALAYSRYWAQRQGTAPTGPLALPRACRKRWPTAATGRSGKGRPRPVRSRRLPWTAAIARWPT